MLHPVAWWVWGVGLATASAHTTNPWLLVLVIAVAGWAVLERREVGALDSFRPFLIVGLVAIGLRVALTILLGNGVPGQVVIVELPQLRLPAWFAGLRLGGQVTLESVVAAGIDGLRLATTLACLGAANALASPRRLLRYAPATLYDIGTAVVVALTFAPALVDLAGRVRSARRLRGHSGTGVRELARLAVPVLEGALDRSLDLAASMESAADENGRPAARSPLQAPAVRWPAFSACCPPRSADGSVCPCSPGGSCSWPRRWSWGPAEMRARHTGGIRGAPLNGRPARSGFCPPPSSCMPRRTPGPGSPSPRCPWTCRPCPRYPPSRSWPRSWSPG
jgi:energy-coupling factor transporter transmembrane protein EcfT